MIKERDKLTAYTREQLSLIREQLYLEHSNMPYKNPVTTDCVIPMNDGTQLAATLVCPDPQKCWPVVLVRNPYVINDYLYTDVYGPIFAGYGYAMLTVCVRGAIRSEGEWLPFEHEREDGLAVLDWIGDQPWCDGNVGTFGASYLGHVQLTLAGTNHPLLKTMFVSVYGNGSYETFYHRGMFREDIFTVWAAQMMGENRLKMRSPKEETALANTTYATYPRKNLDQVLLGSACSWYQDWIHNPESASAYWQQGYWGDMKSGIEELKIPVILCGGWYDIFLRAQIDSWERMPKEIRKESRFIIGPWHHGETTGGELEYPDAQRTGTGQLKAAIAWFDYRLKGLPYEEPLGVVDVYSIRENTWKRYGADFLEGENQKAAFQTWFLGTGKTGHVLQASVPAGDETVEFEYDPQNPVPSRDGMLMSNHEDNLLPPPCSSRQAPIGAREDIVSFVSNVLEEDFRIEGSVMVHLFVSSSAPATAFTVKVSEVLEDGTAFNIRDDITDIRWEEKGTLGSYTPGWKSESLSLICRRLSGNSRRDRESGWMFRPPIIRRFMCIPIRLSRGRIPCLQ